MESEDEEEGEENEEEEEEEEKNPAKGQKTPKRAPPKRGSATGKRVTKSRKRNASEPSDPNDPFNFDAKKDEHPELFKSVHVERKPYGNIKFFKSSTTGSPSKYASMEKNATERRSLIPEPSAADTPGSSKTRTPSSTKKTPAKRGKAAAAVKAEENANETEEFKDEKVEEGGSKKPKTLKADTSAVAKPPKIVAIAPKLSAEDQVTADDESNAHVPKGARVFAIWGKEYYSAICDDSDGLGRYKVFYTEDQSVRSIPRAGVIPLYLVKEGSQVSVLGEKDEDGERAIYEGKVIAIPSIKDTQEWHRGLYKIEVTNDDHPESESREIEWFDIYFTEAQYKKIIKTVKNPTAVDQENVIESGRRTRRSTAVATAASAATTPSTTPSATPKTRGKPGPKPKGTPKAAQKVAEVASPEAEAEKKEDESDSETSKDPSKFFDKLQFILTSANRESGPPPFTKKEVRKQIESRGGNVVETFESMNPDLTTYLIADTFYRTHKYLTALSLSVPTVSFKWINKCVEENKLVDYNDFMLDAGESETTGEVYKWQSLKGKILGGKKVAVYSKRGTAPTNNGIDFCQIWSPIVVNLGGELIDGYPSEIEKAAEFFKNKNTTDYFIADDATPQELINAVTEGNGVPVSSEWIIQTIITGVVAATSGNESYVLQPKY
uniref:BRCT domain-containing protein n=1 Tax=Panagrolaimus superbus TaxID=310955 RepID=A0A914YQF2_9BILA